LVTVHRVSMVVTTVITKGMEPTANARRKNNALTISALRSAQQSTEDTHVHFNLKPMATHACHALPARGLSSLTYRIWEESQALVKYSTVGRLAPMELRDHRETKLHFAIYFTVSTCSRDTQRRNDPPQSRGASRCLCGAHKPLELFGFRLYLSCFTRLIESTSRFFVFFPTQYTKNLHGK
jgi:hypothetical protein